MSLRSRFAAKETGNNRALQRLLKGMAENNLLVVVGEKSGARYLSVFQKTEEGISVPVSSEPGILSAGC